MKVDQSTNDTPVTDAERVDELVCSGKAADELEAFTMLHALDNQEQSHTEAFAAFRAKRDEDRAREAKVTWRKVSDLTGEGWSGLGPNGALVWVGPLSITHYSYGRVVDGRRELCGGVASLAGAKRAA